MDQLALIRPNIDGNLVATNARWNHTLTHTRTHTHTRAVRHQTRWTILRLHNPVRKLCWHGTDQVLASTADLPSAASTGTSNEMKIGRVLRRKCWFSAGKTVVGQRSPFIAGSVDVGHHWSSTGYGWPICIKFPPTPPINPRYAWHGLTSVSTITAVKT
jgi:hypothetical protein